jgi:hypothetical protein
MEKLKVDLCFESQYTGQATVRLNISGNIRIRDRDGQRIPLEGNVCYEKT